MARSSRVVLVGLACIALAIPLSVTLVPPSVGVTPAAACSGTAFMMGSPPGHLADPTTQLATRLPANGRALVFHDRKQSFSWPPKKDDEFRLQVAGGGEVPSTVVELVPGLFAITPLGWQKESRPPPPPTLRVQWHDGSWKHVTTVRFDGPVDNEPPVIDRLGMFWYEEEGPMSSCGSHGPLARVALGVRDASPVVLAAWKGVDTTGPPAAFTAYDPGQEVVTFALGDRNASAIAIVAFDAAGQRSAPSTMALPSFGPHQARPPEPPEPPKRRFGCGKTR